MNQTKELRYAELVLNPCSRTYGSNPCSAAVGVTGDFKCYNSPKTCQDPTNYLAGGEQVLRWVVPTADLPIDIDALPAITSISRRPLTINAGEGLGVREEVTVSLHNFKHNDTGFAKYISDRGYNTYNKGTYWGKFSARWGNIEGYEFRTVDGYVGQTIDEMTRRYYVVTGTAGPDSAGNFSFTAKDAIKLLDGDTAQWPLASNGTLSAEIDDLATELTLTPSGIGDIEYPSSGTASMGDEKVTYTRSGDVITLTGRGLSGSTLDSHDEGETFQQAAVFVAQSPAQIFYELLTNATETPTDYIDYYAWQDECDEYLGRLYSAEVMQPTSVKTLLEEVVREAGLTVFTDVINKIIVMKVLRYEIPTVAVDDDHILAGAISSKKLTSKRVSDVWVYHGKKNPLEKQSEQQNYAAVYAKVTESAVVALENNTSAIREIASRWITVFNQPAAMSVADRIIARYETAPREISFKVPTRYPLTLGGQFTIQSRIFENSQGDEEDPIPCQVTAMEESGGIFTVLSQEVVFGRTTPPDADLRIITISTDVYNINLRQVHDSIYTEAESGQTIRLIIASTGIVGSTTYDSPALDIGDWPDGIIIEIDGEGLISGRGGDSSTSNQDFADFKDGSDALYTRFNVDIIGDVKVWGGGGAGAWGYVDGRNIGGGGAGTIAGTPGGSEEFGGVVDFSNENNGSGGDAGQDGQNGSDENLDPVIGGTAGNSIDGISYVTITGTPDIRGPQVN